MRTLRNERNLSLDLIRIVAVLSVVMIHTSAGFVTSYDVATSEFLWGNIFDSISRIGVPLFVMVSGALFLNENYNFDIKKMLFKNVKNIALLLIFWSVLYACIYQIVVPLSLGKSISIKGIISSSIMGHYHMWYLYMIIGLYLITPFIRYFIKKENKNLVLLFITISIITQFSKPILQGASLFFDDVLYLVDFIDKFYLDFFSGYVTYYILGWYLTNIKIKNEWIFYCFGIVSLLITIIYTQITKDYSNAYSDINLFILAYSVAVFIAVNSIKISNSNVKTIKTIEMLSKLSFGIYIVHPIIQTVFTKIFRYSANPLLYILFYFAVVTILSFTGCFIASKIPIIKKVIRA